MSKIVDVTVGKYDSSVTYLTTPDFKILEYPSSLLPDNIKTGAVLKIQVDFNDALSNQTNKDFISFQNSLLAKMPSFKPVKPVLKVKSRLPTSITVSWDPLTLGIAKLKNVSLWHKALTPQPSLSSSTLDLDEVSSLDEIDEEELSQIATIYNIDSKKFKLTGLNMNSKHVFQLKIDTSNGICASEMIIAETLSSNDLSGFSVCVGALSAGKITFEDIQAVAHSLNITHLSRQCNSDTTHYITDTVDDENEEHDQQLSVAKNSNIPIVTPNWLQGCLTEHKLLGVKGFYYKLSKSDKTNVSEKYPFDKSFTEEYLRTNKKNENVESAVEETEPENSGVKASSKAPAAKEPKVENIDEEPLKEPLEEGDVKGEPATANADEEQVVSDNKRKNSVEIVEENAERATKQKEEKGAEKEREIEREIETGAAREKEEKEAEPENEVALENEAEPEDKAAPEAEGNEEEAAENEAEDKADSEEAPPAKSATPDAAETKTHVGLSPSASKESRKTKNKKRSRK